VRVESSADRHKINTRVLPSFLFLLRRLLRRRRGRRERAASRDTKRTFFCLCSSNHPLLIHNTVLVSLSLSLAVHIRGQTDGRADGRTWLSIALRLEPAEWSDGTSLTLFSLLRALDIIRSNAKKKKMDAKKRKKEDCYAAPFLHLLFSPPPPPPHP